MSNQTDTPRIIADLGRELARVTAERDERDECVAAQAMEIIRLKQADALNKINCKIGSSELEKTRAERDRLAAELARVTVERDKLKEATERLIKAVKLFQLTGVPELVTVDDLIQGMRNVAVKLNNVCIKRAADEARQAERESDRRAGIRRCIDCDAPVGECECN